MNPENVRFKKKTLSDTSIRKHADFESVYLKHKLSRRRTSGGLHASLFLYLFLLMVILISIYLISSPLGRKWLQKGKNKAKTEQSVSVTEKIN